MRDADGTPRDYDIAAQTRATIANIRAVIDEAGASLRDVFDVTAFLIDTDRDFATPPRYTSNVCFLPPPVIARQSILIGS